MRNALVHARRPVLGLLAAALLAGLAGAGALAREGRRLLTFSPLAEAKVGEAALYELEIFDASGRSVSKAEKRFEVAKHEDGQVEVGKIALPDDADAVDVIKALRLLPPGTPLDGLTVKLEPTDVPRSKEKVESAHVSLRAKLQGGATEVVFDAWFAKGIPIFGLVRSRTKILGGGAGESAYEIKDWQRL